MNHPRTGKPRHTAQPSIDAGPLRLRPFTRHDISWVHHVSTDALARHYLNLPDPYRIEHATHFVVDIAADGWTRGEHAEFLTETTATRTPLGRVGLALRHDNTAEIGYWTDPAARGHGTTTHAVRALCGWAFTDLHLDLVEWRTEVGNTASRRVAEKAGFRVEATLRGRLVHRGHRVDAWVGSLYPDELHH